MLKKHGKSKKLSQPIVFLAIIGIALGIAVMILSSSVATGFQNQIRNKVIGFGSHVQIESQFGNESFESSPMLIDSSSIKQLNNEEKIKHVQLYAYKPAILQSKNNSIKDQKAELNAEDLNKLKNLFDVFINKILGLKEQEVVQSNDISEDIMEVIFSIRNNAKKNKDFKTADFIRDELEKKGIQIKDSRDGSSWSLKK